MSGHSTLSPSARARWQLCPASVAASARYTGGKSGAAAIDGTHTHTLLEMALDLSLPASVYVNTKLKDDDGEFTVDVERAKRVQIALDYVTARLTEFPGSRLLTEKRVNPEALMGRDDMSGTVDIQIINDKFIEIIDYKDGVQTVEAAGNPQMEQYAVGVIAEALVEGKTYPMVRMTIIQPKLEMKGLPAVSSAEYPLGHFTSVVIPQMALEAAATDGEGAAYVPGEKQCMYCAHKGACTARIESAFDKAGIKFDAVKTEELPTESKKLPDTLPDAQLRLLVEGAKEIRAMLDAAEEEALRRITHVAPIEGLKVVRGAGRRAWAMDDEDVVTRLTKMGVPKSAVYKMAVITAPNAEKLTWVKRDGTEKKLTAKQLDFIANEMIVKGDGKLTVVPTSDKRKEVEFGVPDAMFKSVETVPAKYSWL